MGKLKPTINMDDTVKFQTWTLLRDCLFCLSSLSMERAEAEAAAARPNATRRIGALRILRLYPTICTGFRILSRNLS